MFRIDAAVALASFFIGKSDRSEMNDLRLMKLMYLAERESIGQIGSTLTGATFASLPKGPILSEILTLSKSSDPNEWTRSIAFEKHDGEKSNHFRMLRPVDYREHFSQAELEILEQVWRDYGSRTKWQLVDLTHEFPEWNKAVCQPEAPARSLPISLEDILEKGLKRDRDTAQVVAEAIRSYEAI